MCIQVWNWNGSFYYEVFLKWNQSKSNSLQGGWCDCLNFDTWFLYNQLLIKLNKNAEYVDCGKFYFSRSHHKWTNVNFNAKRGPISHQSYKMTIDSFGECMRSALLTGIHCTLTLSDGMQLYLTCNRPLSHRGSPRWHNIVNDVVTKLISHQ